MSDAPNLIELIERFHDDDTARAFLEANRWPNGPVCPHCESTEVYRLERKPESKSPVRKGVLKCKACRKQFTVTAGTIFEDSHIALRKWVIAIHLLCSSKKGMSAHQLHRSLGITYKSAWFMAHRIREAMTQSPLAEKLTGIVEADETYVGGKEKNKHADKRQAGNQGRSTKTKTPVFSLVQRGGVVRSFKVANVTGKNLKAIIKQQVATEAKIMTDSMGAYTGLGKEFASHQTVDHRSGEYVRGEAYTNTVENYFSILKRGIYGVYHHVSEEHLHRYCAEFDFRYNARKITDGERTRLAIKAAEGKRLMYKEPAK